MRLGKGKSFDRVVVWKERRIGRKSARLTEVSTISVADPTAAGKGRRRPVAVRPRMPLTTGLALGYRW